MKCRVCKSDSKFIFFGKILNQYDIKYYKCFNCEFIQTENPYWLSEAYSQSINISDTGYMMRNIHYSKYLTTMLYLMFGTRGVFLDYAGGYGVFTRLMRDIGFDFYWYDKFSQNLLARGFEWDKVRHVDAATLFEVFEHFVDPMSEVCSLLNITDTIIFSTELIPEPTPKIEDWWYYGTEHGQHIAFYSKKTLGFMAQHFDLNYYNLGSLNIITKKDLSNKIFLAKYFNKLGINKVVSKILHSKTLTDYKMLSKVDI